MLRSVEKPNSPVLSDPLFIMAIVPILAAFRRMGERIADLVAVEDDNLEPVFDKRIEQNNLGVVVDGLSPVVIETARYSMRVGGKLVVSAEAKSLLVDGELYDFDMTCAWHPQVEVEMQALLKRLNVPILLLMAGLGYNLRPRHEVIPGLLVIHLGQKKVEPNSAAQAPFRPAEAASDGPSVMYPGHHNEGYQPAQEPVRCSCQDDNPSWDGPSNCAGCENFAICHPAAAAEANVFVGEPLRKAA